MFKFSTLMISQSIDARGLNCPIPVMKAKNDITALIASQMLEVFSSDPASLRDMDAMYRSTRNILLSSEDQTDGSFRFLIETK